MTRQYRTEATDDEAQREYAPGPRATLARTLADAWRPDHRPQTLREEIQQRELGPRNFLAHELRNAHLPDAKQYNARVDALVEAELSPREALAKETAGLWKGETRGGAA